ncbi:hypothetical protein FQA39_LY16519 [Lamprigera yunnana]|nr:hypothetical protein FQA39_LY16519 [Lamprigera yunnana]
MFADDRTINPEHTPSSIVEEEIRHSPQPLTNDFKQTLSSTLPDELTKQPEITPANLDLLVNSHCLIIYKQKKPSQFSLTMNKCIGGTEESEDITMTPQELHVLSELDSRQYGFLILKSTENTKKRALVAKAVKYIQLMVIQAQRQSIQYEHESTINHTSTVKKISIDPKTWIKLGHFHLLLDEYRKALSAYQMFYKTQATNHWMEPTFLYGLGLVYFHFNSFQWQKRTRNVPIL